jgi:hypothetical protein
MQIGATFPDPMTPVSIAMAAKVGAAARRNQFAALVVSFSLIAAVQRLWV